MRASTHREHYNTPHSHTHTPACNGACSCRRRRCTKRSARSFSLHVHVCNMRVRRSCVEMETETLMDANAHLMLNDLVWRWWWIISDDAKVANMLPLEVEPAKTSQSRRCLTAEQLCHVTAALLNSHRHGCTQNTNPAVALNNPCVCQSTTTGTVWVHRWHHTPATYNWKLQRNKNQ